MPAPFDPLPAKKHPEMLAYNAHGFNEGATSHDYFIFNNKWAEYKRQ